MAENMMQKAKRIRSSLANTPVGKMKSGGTVDSDSELYDHNGQIKPEVLNNSDSNSKPYVVTRTVKELNFWEF